MTRTSAADRQAPAGRLASLVPVLIPTATGAGPWRIPEAARPPWLAARRHDLEPGRPLVVVTRTNEEAHWLADDLAAWLEGSVPQVLAERGAIPLERALPEREESAARLEVLADLGRRHSVMVASLLALAQRTLSVEQLAAAARTVAVGKTVNARDLMTALLAGGYEATSEVTGVGEYAVRGGLIDIWPPGSGDPVRIELFGDTVESLRLFDPMTQASRRRLERIRLLPASEFIPEAGWKSLAAAPVGDHEILEADLARLEQGEVGEAAETWARALTAGPAADHLPPDADLVLHDPALLWATAVDLDAAVAERIARLADAGEIPPTWPPPFAAATTLALLESRATTVESGGDGRDPGYRPAPLPAGDRDALAGWLQGLAAGGGRVIVTTDQAHRLAELLEDTTTSVEVVLGSLQSGFALPDQALLVLSDRELFGASRIRRRLTAKRVVTRDLIGRLEVGDLVVHVDHGIARYAGMTQRQYGADVHEYLQLDFAGDDKIFLPADQIGRIGRYAGGPTPPLSRLGGREWARTRSRVERAVADLADELLELYAAREDAPGFAFSEDTVWQTELEEAFPYSETPDQERTIAAVKADMLRRRPMDRLVCGDVGYGKTEVAIRAAFRAVQDGRQVAVLVPTTVLAQQHLHTFRQRMAPFPIRVEVMSRFVSKAHQVETLAGLAAGTVDVVVGTHRLLSRDVQFRQLGLLVVDEEHRFGVTHKERIKQLRREVDVLTLSATPIPRTLHLSLVGIRDLSVIETAPEARLPIQTRIAEDDDGLVRDAIVREIDRGGQAFYVHNRVETIEAAAERVRRLVPRAHVAIGHGQMAEGMLERVMLDFDAGKFDVLVCTTIIESGLDIPNANTIIIARADTFGLAQLYQLRGRVGRSDRRAHAYLLHRRGSPLSLVARRRLHAIFSASDLGAGYQIALSDLEIRGAGNILGPEQSGHLAAVGFDLYTQLLADAVDARRGHYRPPDRAPVRLDLPGSAFLPDTYIAEAGAKLEIYRRFAQLKTDDKADALRAHLLDRFGPIPSEVEGLFRAVAVRQAAESAGVPEVSVEAVTVALKWPGYDRPTVLQRLSAAGFRPSFTSNQVRVPVAAHRDPIDTALRVLAALGSP